MTTLTRIYTLLREHFGALTGPDARRPWWPIYGADPPFEMLVGAVLVQQTRWETVEAAIRRLIAAELLSPPAMALAAPDELAALVRPSAFHTQKAPGLITIARHISERYAGSTALMLAQPTDALRAELLALPRIGRETCDVIMLYGGGRPIFVVDEYTRRLFERVAPALGDRETGRPGDPETRRPGDPETGSASDRVWRQPYEAVRSTIEAELNDPRASSLIVHPSSLYAEFHAQINEACVRYCLSTPRCDGPPARRVYSRQDGRESYLDRHDGCPLRSVCRYYQGEEWRGDDGATGRPDKG